MPRRAPLAAFLLPVSHCDPPTSAPAVLFDSDLFKGFAGLLGGKFGRWIFPTGLPIIDVDDCAAVHILAMLNPNASGRWACLRPHLRARAPSPSSAAGGALHRQQAPCPCLRRLPAGDRHPSPPACRYLCSAGSPILLDLFREAHQLRPEVMSRCSLPDAPLPKWLAWLVCKMLGTWPGAAPPAPVLLLRTGGRPSARQVACGRPAA